MEKTYDPKQLENTWSEHWEQHHYFAPSGKSDPYCIMIPPPNVTGTLHMGHGFQYTLMDALTRYHRMSGDNTLWQMGMDHAGIATQMVVELELTKQQQTRRDLGREAFTDKVWEWKTHSGGQISQQMRRLGTSVDWSRERFTMDEGLSKAVKEVFIKLYQQGLIYRGQRLVNWDPHFMTAISDLEVVSEEADGHLWHIRYPLVKGDGEVVVATTRPETLLGDMAVAVHPDDPRYQTLIGQHVQLPLTDRTIPIIADDYVDPEFGSGCVKITPAHDFNDYEVGKRHDLTLLNILTPDGKLNDNAPQAYQGLDRFVARKQIISDLKTQKLLLKTDDHKLVIPRGDRSGVVIEPYLTDQWYVKMAPLAEPAIAAVKNGDVKFIPENWDKTYYQWLENIEDWCISRQLWWGHRIPAWYDEAGNVYVGEDEATVRMENGLGTEATLTQDEDVLDTWFSSALWPFSTLGWPEKTKEFQTFYPSNVLVTGFDIIFFWVARMVMMGLHFTGKVPFKEVYITGLIRDSEGKKMSKSKGNVIDPLDLVDGIDLESLVNKRTRHMMQPQLAAKVEKATRKDFPDGISAHGVDAVRFNFCALASTGRDIRFDLQRLEGYRHFCNKLWNAARYVLMNTADQKPTDSEQAFEYSLPDRWIQSRLQAVITKSHECYHNYRFDLLAKALHEFVWHEYCDWYLELSKPVLYSDDSAPALKRGTRRTLITVLETVLRLLHPIMPFITEEIWQQVAPVADVSGDTIMLQPFPQVDIASIDETVEADITWLQIVITGIRNIRGEMNIAPGKLLPVYLHKGSEQDNARLQQHHDLLKSLAKCDSITWLTEDATPPAAATALAGEMEILVPLAGFIDKAAETERLIKNIDKLCAELLKLQAKLNNPSFVNNAPPAVVDKTKLRIDEINVALTKLRAQQEKIAAI